MSSRHPPAELIAEATVSCATAEGLLRGMLVRLDFSNDELLAHHLNELDNALAAISREQVRHPSVVHITAARDAIRAAMSAFDPWVYSSDPEHQHLRLFQREALRHLERATSEREAAAAASAPE